MQGSLAERSLITRKVQVSNQVQEDDQIASMRRLLYWVNLNSLLCAPLVVKGKNLGVLLVWNKWDHHFTPNDNRLMSLFADQAALAWQNAQLHAKNRQSGYCTRAPSVGP